jgi:hypothetical protein
VMGSLDRMSQDEKENAVGDCMDALKKSGEALGKAAQELGGFDAVRAHARRVTSEKYNNQGGGTPLRDLKLSNIINRCNRSPRPSSSSPLMTPNRMSTRSKSAPPRKRKVHPTAPTRVQPTRTASAKTPEFSRIAPNMPARDDSGRSRECAPNIQSLI